MVNVLSNYSLHDLLYDNAMLEAKQLDPTSKTDADWCGSIFVLMFARTSCIYRK